MRNTLKSAKYALASVAETAQLDAEILLALALKKNREFLYSHPEYQLTKAEKAKFARLLKRRLAGEPIAYILGKREFWSLELMVNKSVLIPRPETELLVELALTISKPKATVADLGTGSGAIALALAKERPKWQIYAVDKSKKALEIGQLNANNLKLKNVEFCCGDWLKALPKIKFDAIVSNPPYIAENDPHLKQGDVRFEPKMALQSNISGMQAIIKIVKQAKNYLKKDGVLLIEHGCDHGQTVRQLMRTAGFSQVKTFQDLAGLDRVTVSTLS